MNLEIDAAKQKVPFDPKEGWPQNEENGGGDDDPRRPVS